MSRHLDLELTIFTPKDLRTAQATLKDWRNNREKIGALQTLLVRAWEGTPNGLTYKDLLKSLVQFFGAGKDRLQSFRTLRWEVDTELPPSLLRMFETNYPSWSIHFRSIPPLAGVPSSPAVTSLTVALYRERLAKDEAYLPNVQGAIQNLKNLKKLHLYIHVGGCVRYSYTNDFSENGGAFPPLEELALEWFWVTQSCGEYWMKAMNWSHLRVLDFREGSLSIPFLSLLLPVADKLPALEGIGLNLPYWTEENLQEQKNDTNSAFSLIRRLFLTTRPQSLRDVRIHGYHRPLLPDVINNHSTSLKSLSLHEEEMPREDTQRVPLSSEELVEIGTKSKGLEGLALDMNISKEHAWPGDVIDTIASPLFSSLKTLRVFSFTGISGYNERNNASATSVATTEEDVKNLSVSLGLSTSLDEIKVQIGEKRTVMGFPVPWVMWEESHRRTVTMSRKDGFSSRNSARDI